VGESSKRRLVRARFGLPLHAAAGARRAQALRARAAAAAAGVHHALRPGQIALVTGPSGSGKSMILRAVPGPAVWALPVEPGEHRAPVDLIRWPVEPALHLLASVGLADAWRLVTPGGRCSEGERWRLGLAVAIAQALQTGVGTILADEFASTLDWPTARGVAGAVRRALPSTLRLIAATARDEIAGPLRPELLVYVPFEAPAELHTREAAPARTDTDG
jgi:ABC-type ATPase with predicted acetyltransferase domain